MTEDSELLRLYVQEKSQTAFAELVKRYINQVYAGALRRLGGDTHLAEDATQRVFMALAAAAGKLCRRPVLAGWLHVATRNVAVQIVRSERRRAARELKAQASYPAESPDSTRAADWERLRPVIDGALDELEEDDREAVIMRYFQGQSHAEIGARLRLKENTARMRVERALERMQQSLVRRGVTSTGAALTLALANQAGVAAPPGLAATVSSAVLAQAAIAATGFTILTTMSATKAVSDGSQSPDCRDAPSGPGQAGRPRERTGENARR